MGGGTGDIEYRTPPTTATANDVISEAVAMSRPQAASKVRR